MINLKPKVIVNGGFYKNGAIVEGDQGTEYVRTGIDTVCVKLYFNKRSIIFSKEVAYDEAEEVDELTAEDIELARASGDDDDLKFDERLKKYAVKTEFLLGRAQIQNGSFGRYSFSYFGSAKEFSELALSIERSDADRLTISGYEEVNDVGVQQEEGFGIEMRLRDSSFDELHAKLRGGFTNIKLRVSLALASKFFATWSPMYNEGRVIKYLGSVSDLENPKDLPQHFNVRNPRSLRFWLYMSEPFNIGSETDADSEKG